MSDTRKKIRIDDDLHEPLKDLGKRVGRTKTNYTNHVLRTHIRHVKPTERLRRQRKSIKPEDGTK